MINAQVTNETVEAPSVRISIREMAAPSDAAPEHGTSERKPLILYGAPRTTAGTTELRLSPSGVLRQP
jgi:hypothetical protein